MERMQRHDARCCFRRQIIFLSFKPGRFFRIAVKFNNPSNVSSVWRWLQPLYNQLVVVLVEWWASKNGKKRYPIRREAGGGGPILLSTVSHRSDAPHSFLSQHVVSVGSFWLPDSNAISYGAPIKPLNDCKCSNGNYSPWMHMPLYVMENFCQKSLINYSSRRSGTSMYRCHRNRRICASRTCLGGKSDVVKRTKSSLKCRVL